MCVQGVYYREALLFTKSAQKTTSTILLCFRRWTSIVPLDHVLHGPWTSLCALMGWTQKMLFRIFMKTAVKEYEYSFKGVWVLVWRSTCWIEGVLALKQVLMLMSASWVWVSIFGILTSTRTREFDLLTSLIKPHSQWHNKTCGRTARPSTQNRNMAQGNNMQCVRHPQMWLSKTKANGPRRIASWHVELATAEAATHVSLRCTCKDVGILLEGALWLAIR